MVEDNESMQDVLREALADHDLTVVGNLSDALLQLSLTTFDLVLTDFNYPLRPDQQPLGCGVLLADRCLKDGIPVVLMSATRPDLSMWPSVSRVPFWDKTDLGALYGLLKAVRP